MKNVFLQVRAMIKVAICDAYLATGDRVRNELARSGDIAFVGRAFDSDIMTLIRSTEVHVLVLAFAAPADRGLELIKRLRSEKPLLRIVALTAYSTETGDAIRAFRAGASGFLIRSSPPEELLHAIRKVASGGIYVGLGTPVDPTASSDEAAGTSPHLRLSDHEFHVFLRIACGQALPEIAETLGTDATAICEERANILQKMELPNDAALTRYAAIRKLIAREYFRTR
ncbi:response regulator [Paraburkholderia sp. RL17-373-BIF-A]|uniref:response regulator n=1 Tax=Paraburkholderia sp. RL17-373-BIF-A TaxID=3031629 RepID=UPI0038B83109